MYDYHPHFNKIWLQNDLWSLQLAPATPNKPGNTATAQETCTAWAIVPKFADFIGPVRCARKVPPSCQDCEPQTTGSTGAEPASKPLLHEQKSTTGLP